MKRGKCLTSHASCLEYYFSTGGGIHAERGSFFVTGVALKIFLSAGNDPPRPKSRSGTAAESFCDEVELYAKK